jgi:hypothetical protein
VTVVGAGALYATQIALTHGCFLCFQNFENFVSHLLHHSLLMAFWYESYNFSLPFIHRTHNTEVLFHQLK